MSEEKKSQWFETWFDSPYYHLLYQNRDDSEAALFLNNLTSKLHLPPTATLWDMACGKGRHVRFLLEKGLSAIGSDLSENSIQLALNSNLPLVASPFFYVHDMRDPLRVNYFDVVLNVFTSIGYFEDYRDNERVFLSAAKSLKKGGYFVLDFFNSEKVIRELIKQEKKNISGIDFDIQRAVENNRIIKSIKIKDHESEFLFEERVQLLNMEDFVKYAVGARLQKLHAFGDYRLSAFDKSNSERLILIFIKS